MKMTEKERTVWAYGLDEVASFKIKVSGKAFRILLDGLYSNKIKAMIRELSTNAWDGLQMAGRTSTHTFDVQLPTVLDPVFRVRDYGCSMTHDQVMNLYSTLFDSSKDNRNDQVGMLGLGSKSPFAYTDTFTATAWKDGQKRVYTAFLDAEGIPQIALMPGGVSDSDEHEGFEVSVAVNVKDCADFLKNAVEVFQWFPITPKFSGREISIQKPKPSMEGKGWYMREGAYGATLVRQGCVVYPVDTSAIPGLSEVAKAMLSAPFVVDFPIGTLDVAPSREALSYNETTCRNIMARMNSLSKEIADKYTQEIDKAPTLWEAGKVLRTVVLSSVPTSLKSVVSSAQYNGVKLNEPITATRLKSVVGVEHVGKIETHRARNLKTLDVDYRSMRNFDRNALSYGEDVQIIFSLSDQKPSYEGMRVQQAWNKRDEILYIKVNDEAAVNRVLDVLGNPTDFTLTKDLPKPTIIKSKSITQLAGKTKKEQVKARKFDIATADPHSAVWGNEELVDLDGGAIYLLVRSGRPIYANGHHAGQEYNDSIWINAIKSSYKLKYFDTSLPIYAISVVYAERLKSFAKWKDFTTAIPEKIRSLQDDYNRAAEEHEVYKRATSTSGPFAWCNTPEFKRYAASVNDGHIIRTLAEVGHKQQSAVVPLILKKDVEEFRYVFYDAVREIADKATEHVQKNSQMLKDITAMQDMFNITYPVLNHFRTQTNLWDVEAAITYVQQMDTLRKLLSERQSNDE